MELKRRGGGVERERGSIPIALQGIGVWSNSPFEGLEIKELAISHITLIENSQSFIF